MSATCTDVGPRMVIINDEKRIADTLALSLRSAGYMSAVAYDGRFGLATRSEFRPLI